MPKRQQIFSQDSFGSALEWLGEQMPGGFFIYRASDEEILYINNPALHIFGCENVEQFAEMTGNTFKGLVHPQDYESIRVSINKQIQENSIEKLDCVEYSIVRRDGAVREGALAVLVRLAPAPGDPDDAVRTRHRRHVRQHLQLGHGGARSPRAGRLGHHDVARLRRRAARRRRRGHRPVRDPFVLLGVRGVPRLHPLLRRRRFGNGKARPDGPAVTEVDPSTVHPALPDSTIVKECKND